MESVAALDAPADALQRRRLPLLRPEAPCLVRVLTGLTPEFTGRAAVRWNEKLDHIYYGGSMEDHIELPELVEQTANMLRGMTMDPAIPAHAKEAMWARIRTLDSAVEHAMSVDAEAVGWAYGKCVALGLENCSQESAMMMDRLKMMLGGYGG